MSQVELCPMVLTWVRNHSWHILQVIHQYVAFDWTKILNGQKFLLKIPGDIHT